MLVTLALILGTMLRLSSSSAAAMPQSMNGSLTQMVFDGLGCNDSKFYGEDITTSLAVMEDNVFCVGGVSEAFHGKYTTTCDDDEKTVMFRWHDCNTTDCSICDGEETILSGTWVTPLSVWDAPTEETCFDADMLPPYDPSWNTTTMSYRFIDDPSTYASIVVENSCISKSLALAGGISIVSLQLNSSGEWVNWFYVVVSVGLAVIFLDRWFATNCQQEDIEHDVIGIDLCRIVASKYFL